MLSGTTLKMTACELVAVELQLGKNVFGGNGLK